LLELSVSNFVELPELCKLASDDLVILSKDVTKELWHSTLSLTTAEFFFKMNIQGLGFEEMGVSRSRARALSKSCEQFSSSVGLV
jgi:hypothetical protein